MLYRGLVSGILPLLTWWRVRRLKDNILHARVGYDTHMNSRWPALMMLCVDVERLRLIEDLVYFYCEATDRLVLNELNLRMYKYRCDVLGSGLKR